MGPPKETESVRLSKELLTALENRRKTLVGRIPKAAKHNVPYLLAIAAELSRISFKTDPSAQQASSTEE